jgi:hypothetical protein
VAQAVEELGLWVGEQHNPSAQLGEVAADLLRIGGALSTARRHRGGWWTALACFGQLFTAVAGLGKVPTQRRRVRVVGGCCSRGESRREAADGGAHRLGVLGIAAVNGEASRGERRRSKKGFTLMKLCRAGIRLIAQRT